MTCDVEPLFGGKVTQMPSRTLGARTVRLFMSKEIRMLFVYRIVGYFGGSTS
jgi:hypothetical protein